jgi:hypothetical protein
MMRKYSLNEIANLLTRTNPCKVYTAERVWQWCREGLRYEPLPDSIQGVSYKRVWIDENDLKDFLQRKGFDVDYIFTE